MNNRVMKNDHKESDVKYIKKVTTEKTAKTAAAVKPAADANAQTTGAKVYGSPCLPQYSD